MKKISKNIIIGSLLLFSPLASLTTVVSCGDSSKNDNITNELNNHIRNSQFFVDEKNEEKSLKGYKDPIFQILWIWIKKNYPNINQKAQMNIFGKWKINFLNKKDETKATKIEKGKQYIAEIKMDDLILKKEETYDGKNTTIKGFKFKIITQKVVDNESLFSNDNELFDKLKPLIKKEKSKIKAGMLVSDLFNIMRKNLAKVINEKYGLNWTYIDVEDYLASNVAIWYSATEQYENDWKTKLNKNFLKNDLHFILDGSFGSIIQSKIILSKSIESFFK